MISLHAGNRSDTDKRIGDLRAEIARLKARRRELTQRIGRRRATRRKSYATGTDRAEHSLEIERKRIDERIAVLEAAARSSEGRGQALPTTSSEPGVYVDQGERQTSELAQDTATVIRTSRLSEIGIYRKWRAIPRIARSRLLWTIGNALMLTGIVLLLYVGGVYAAADYSRYAARGDTDVPAPVVVADPAPYEPAPFVAPNLSAASAAEGQVRGAIPDAARAAHVSTVARVAIPSIGVDSKVVEVGWDVTEQAGQQVAIWQVAEYAVGQHRGSANPGEGDNIVLAGHVGGYGKVFKNLFYINPGDQITLYSNGQQYLYIVQERLVLTEEGVSPEQQAANAHYIAPTHTEVVTLVTCWPPTGSDRFTQRIVVRAVPFGSSAAQQPIQSRWTVR